MKAVGMQKKTYVLLAEQHGHRCKHDEESSRTNSPTRISFLDATKTFSAERWLIDKRWGGRGKDQKPVLR